MKNKKGLPNMGFGDAQMNSVVKGYLYDPDFGVNEDKEISLWNVFNLFTDAAKSTYIDTFLDRNLNAFELCSGLVKVLDTGQGEYNWFLE